MKLVIDANIVMAALLKDALTRHIILISDLLLYSPPHLLEELEKYCDFVSFKVGISAAELHELQEILLENVSIVQKSEFEVFLPKAKAVVCDSGDVAYLALALKLGCPIWSNDKALKQQSVVKVYSTGELLELLRA